jgi:23S rRNA (uracil1939-C5)-methyltransferase
VGFQARRSHRVIDVDHCPALDPRLDRAMNVARTALRSSVGDGGTISGLVAGDGRVHLHVEGGDRAAPETLADHAQQLLGQEGIVGVGVRSIDGNTSRYYGEPRLDMGGGMMASAAGFAQANATQNDILRRIVSRWAFGEEPAEAPERILELYAGDGNFTRDLVRRARVVAVEGDRDASARLVDNLRAVAPRTHESVDRWAVRAESSDQAVAKLAAAGERFDVIVMDPPRAGAADILDGLAMLRARRIVYVSCDPMTLARDLMRLGDLGYRAVRACPIDMMPHTSHVEIVCLLELVPKPAS